MELMANYTNMITNNRNKSDEMLNVALTTISEMLQDGEKVQICELVKRTGFSRGYFYNNEIVHNAYEEAQRMQIGKVFPDRKKEAIGAALKKENQLLRGKIQTLEKQIELLMKQLETKSNSEFDFIESL